MADVTSILNAIEQGDPKAAEELLPIIYDELRHLAAQKMSQEPPGQTLQATALVHEAYIRLVEAKDQNWNSRNHFFMAAAEAMRRILVENARRKKSLKRGGDKNRIEFEESMLIYDKKINTDDFLSLNDALEKLYDEDKMAADLIKLRVFGGLTVDQAADMLQISTSKAYEYIEYARAWLRVTIAGNNEKTEF